LVNSCQSLKVLEISFMGALNKPVKLQFIGLAAAILESQTQSKMTHLMLS